MFSIINIAIVFYCACSFILGFYAKSKYEKHAANWILFSLFATPFISFAVLYVTMEGKQKTKEVIQSIKDKFKK